MWRKFVFITCMCLVHPFLFGKDICVGGKVEMYGINDHYMHSYTISFTDLNGNPHEFYHSFRISAGLRMSDSVTVYYPENDPSKAVLYVEGVSEESEGIEKELKYTVLSMFALSLLRWFYAWVKGEK